MTTSAKKAFGSELWMAAHNATLVKVAELITVTPPKRKRDFIDATTHDSAAGAAEFIPEGVFDPGDIPFQVNYIAGSAGDLAMVGFLTGATFIDWKIVAKSAAGTVDITGSGYLAEYGPDDLPTRGKQTASGSIKVSGTQSQAATP